VVNLNKSHAHYRKLSRSIVRFTPQINPAWTIFSQDTLKLPTCEDEINYFPENKLRSSVTHTSIFTNYQRMQTSNADCK